MLSNVVHQKRLAFYAVLMDTWCAARELMLFIESLQKIHYCPLKASHHVDDSGGRRPYCRMDALQWHAEELVHGRQIRINDFPNNHKDILLNHPIGSRVHRVCTLAYGLWQGEAIEYLRRRIDAIGAHYSD